MNPKLVGALFVVVGLVQCIFRYDLSIYYFQVVAWVAVFGGILAIASARAQGTVGGVVYGVLVIFMFNPLFGANPNSSERLELQFLLGLSFFAAAYNYGKNTKSTE